MKPRVFLSHATEDKEKFANVFAKRLLDTGVDVWYDKWEMLPGDSLVDKIFEEGLKDTSAVIIIISSNSVSKPWVREELNSSIVSRITKGTKIIPVIIDKCEIPEALKSTLWVEIKDLTKYDDEFSSIIASIFNKSQKPPSGQTPAFVQETPKAIVNILASDTLVLKRSCEFLIQTGRDIIDPDDLFGKPEEFDLTKSQIIDSLTILEDQSYITLSRYLGPSDCYNCRYQVSVFGFEKYSDQYYPEYRQYKDQCAGYIVNDGFRYCTQLIEATGASKPVIDFILKTFESHDMIKMTQYASGQIGIYDVSVKFKRFLDQ